MTLFPWRCTTSGAPDPPKSTQVASFSDGDPRPVEHDADAVRAVKALLEEFL
jgi:hypothetical protein